MQRVPNWMSLNLNRYIYWRMTIPYIISISLVEKWPGILVKCPSLALCVNKKDKWAVYMMVSVQQKGFRNFKFPRLTVQHTFEIHPPLSKFFVVGINISKKLDVYAKVCKVDVVQVDCTLRGNIWRIVFIIGQKGGNPQWHTHVEESHTDIKPRGELSVQKLWNCTDTEIFSWT